MRNVRHALAGATPAATVLLLLSSALTQAQNQAAEQPPNTTTDPSATQSIPIRTAEAADGSDALQEVVVTAQFRQERLQDTPIAITAVSAEMLEQRSQTSIADVTNQAPNVTLKTNSAAFGNSLAASIRGVGQYDFNPALEPGVGMYIDDVYYSTLTGSNFDLLDLDRVEILRGPQGTLAGKNSIGGAVKLYSKKPDGEGGGYVSATYGQFSRTDIRASGDFSIVPEKLFARISGVSRHSDGYVQRFDYACTNPGSGLPTLVLSGGCELGRQGGLSYAAARAAFRWLPSELIEVNLVGDVTNDNSETPATTLLYASNTNPNVAINGVPYDSRFIPSSPYITYSTFFDAGGTYSTPLGPVTKTPFLSPASNEFDGWGVAGTADFNFTETLALKSISAYRYYKSQYGNDNDASPLPVSQGQGLLTHRQFSQELRLNGTLGEKIDYTVGGFYFDQTTKYATHQDLQYVPAVGPLFTFLGDDPVDASTEAGFLHVVFHATDKLNLIGGYRYSQEDKDYTFVRLTPTGVPHPLLGALNGVTGRFEGTRSDYRADIDYKWTEDFMTYAQFSTGYKGGGINPRPFTAVQVRPFGPETLDAYEIGVKSILFSRKVRLNAAVFYNEYNDIQLTLLACPERPCAQPSNAGDAEVKGVEVETEIRPVPGLSIDAAASYLDFEYTRIAPNVAGVTFGMITPFTPEVKANIGVSYEFPIGSAGTLTPRVDASYQDELFTNAVNAPTNRIASYTLVNARVTWRSPEDTWQTAAELTNLTNKVYYNSVFDLFTIEGDVTANVGMPRAWAVTVRRNFQ